MFYGDSIQEIRKLYFSSWEHYKFKKPLSALEQQIVQVIIDHPEYHQVLDNKFAYQDHNYYPELGETNPFLHMGLHLGIREQVATNRPAGIQHIYEQLLAKYADPLHVEHLMMEQLAESIWLAQKNNTVPDEGQYMTNLSTLI
jgi:hypothetical protein